MVSAVGLLAWTIVAALFAALIAILSPETSIENLTERLLTGPYPMLISLPGFLWLILATWLFVRVWEKRPFGSIGLRSKRPLLEWLRGIGLGMGMLGLSVAIPAILGWIRFEGSGGVGDRTSWVGYSLAYLAFFMIQGPAEEIQCRGYLLPVLGARGGLWVGILVSSVVFALQHVLNPGIGVLAVVNLGLSGVFFALYALVEGSLWGVFGFHAAWNWAQGSLLGLEVSGDTVAAAHAILDLTETGPDWFTGGAFGPEGGLAVTLVLLAGILFLWGKLRE